MALWDTVTRFLALGSLPSDPVQVRSIDPFESAPTFQQKLDTVLGRGRTSPWRLASISEALSVPSIQRAVSLIANTTGSLSVEGFRNSAAMAEVPRLLQRPDPYSTPRDFYRDSAYYLATRGECVWYIASRDGDDLTTALFVVPLAELNVEENTRNRLFPIYTWGQGQGGVTSTRYSPANPTGKFVHMTYLKEPGTLRGVGPLQLCGAAVSVAVEAQEWAANFYSNGGNPSILIKSALELNENEAVDLKEQWTDSPNNVPRVITPSIEEVKEMGVNEQGAQLLESRNYNNGDTARNFGIPGALLEYNASGSSLTYQNVAEVYTQFVRTSLSINYLEPMEQALTDLMPRSTTARFYVEGLMRADIKTRFDVYKTGIESGVLDIERAQVMEGIAPGSIEVAPVLATPPAAVPSSLPQLRTALVALRCDGMTSKRRAGISRLEKCNRLLSETGVFVGPCPRCRKEYTAQPVQSVKAPVLVPTLAVRATPQPLPVEVVRVEPPNQMVGVIERFTEALNRPQPQPQVNVTFDRGAFDIHTPVTVAEGAVHVDGPTINVEPSPVTISEGAVRVDVAAPDMSAFRTQPEPPTVTRIVKDEDGNVSISRDVA